MVKYWNILLDEMLNMSYNCVENTKGAVYEHSFATDKRTGLCRNL